MSYPVPCIPQGSITWQNDIEIVPAANLLSILQKFDTVYAGKRIGFDIEATGLDPFKDQWDMTGFTLSLRTGKSTGKSYYVDFRYPNQAPRGFVLEYFRGWLKKNQKRLWAFNNSYEYKGMLRLTGQSHQFSDARALTIAAHVSGGLKAITQKYIAAHDWEVANSHAVSLIGILVGKLGKSDLDRLRSYQIKRRQQEESNCLDTDIYSFLGEETVEWIKGILPWQNTVDYINEKIKLRGTGQVPTKEYVNKGEIKLVDWELSATEVVIESAILAGLRFEDILMGCLYDPSSGWGSVPTRILGPYCGWDGFYTVALADTFLTDPRLAACYEAFEKEIMFAGVLESYGQCWDDRACSEMDHAYLVIANDSLADVVSACDLGDDDQWGQREKLVNLLKRGVQFPVNFEFKYLAGGDYYGSETVWVYDLEELNGQKVMVEALMQARAEAGKSPTKAPANKLAAILEAIEVNPSRIKQIVDSYKSTDPNVGNWMVNRLADGKKAWFPVDSLAAYMNITGEHRVKYTRKIERETTIETREILVDTEEKRLSILKDYFNPGSNTDETKEKFWRPYLTPKVLTANLFYGLMKYLEECDLWEYVAGWMVDTDVQDTDAEGKLKFDEDGDPVMKQELRPRPIKFVDNETGQIEEINEIFINRYDLRESIQNLNRLCEMVNTKVDWKYIDTSPDKLRELAKVNDFAVQYQEKRKEVVSAANTLKTSVQKSIDSLSSYISKQTGGFSSDLVELQHNVHTEFLGLKLSDRDTWLDEYKMIINLRLYKKCMKNRSTYLIGDKLGRGSVGRTAIPIVEGATEEQARLSSFSRPVITNSYWRELDRTGSYDEMHLLSDHNQLFLASDFNPVSTETRRWRSKNHTVPAASELRRCYKARDRAGIMDHSDFSGMELATVAAIAGEDSMIQAFIRGDDIHMNTAMGVYNLPREEVTPMMRRYAKICTFLILYGGELPALARAVGGSMSRAKQIMDGFYNAYPKLKKYIDDYRAMARDKGYVLTINGAPLNIDRTNLATVGTTSINYPIQGSATMVGGTAFCDMWLKSQEMKLPFIPTSFTHDSLDSEQHPASYFLTKGIMRFCAENEVLRQWNIPARLDGESGTSTYELVHTKLKSKFNAGSETDPHVLELKGPINDIEKLIAKFDPWYQIEREDKFDKTVTAEINELWIARRSFNTNMISGNPYDEYKVSLKLARKTEIFIPDMSKPLYQQMQAAGL